MAATFPIIASGYDFFPFVFGVGETASVAFEGTSPFVEPPGVPEDVNGPLSAFESGVIFLTPQIEIAPYPDSLPNVDITLSMVVTFTAGGVTVKTISHTFSATLVWNGIQGRFDASNFQSSVAPDAPFTPADYPGVYGTTNAANNGGTYLGATKVGTTLLTGFNAPGYRYDIPLGATATVALSATTSVGSVTQFKAFARIAATPVFTAQMGVDGVVTASKVSGPHWKGTPLRSSLSPGAFLNYTATAWDAYYLDGDDWQHVSAPPGDTATFNVSGAPAYVRVTTQDGLTGWVFVQGTPLESSDQYGPIITPTGTLYIPSKSGSGSKIVRFNQGVAPETVIELPTEKGVHLMLWGAIFYKGNSANLLEKSADEGGTWTVLSDAFTSDYKCIDWVLTAPDAGFIAIATKNKLLYSATSFDGTNWGAPVFQFGDGSRDVSRSQIEQSSASDESHILIGDGTYCVRSDDYCATPGEVLFQ